MKNSKRFFVFIEAALAVMILIVVFIMLREKNSGEQQSVSVIVRDSDDNQWSAFRYGLKMAAEDLGINLCVVSTEERFTVEEEKRLIERELENGADALIVQPAPSEDTKEMLEKAGKKIPIMLVGSKPFSEGRSTVLPVTEANHYEMGTALAKELLEDYSGSISGKTLGILSAYEEVGSVRDREKGFLDAVREKGGTVSWTISSGAEMEKMEEFPAVDFVIAMDDTSLVKAGELAALGELHGALVYGIGNSTEAVYYLDSGHVRALIVPDEFLVGYQSLSEVARRLKRFAGEMEDQIVSYTIFRRENMFRKENQEILYTMSQ